MAEDEKKQIVGAHTDFPDPRCELFFERALKPIADSILTLSQSLDTLVEKHDQFGRTLHGQNYNNGMVLQVAQHEETMKELKKLPAQMQSQMLRWGFFLLAGNGTVSAITIGIILWLVRGS